MIMFFCSMVLICFLEFMNCIVCFVRMFVGIYIVGFFKKYFVFNKLLVLKKMVLNKFFVYKIFFMLF